YMFFASNAAQRRELHPFPTRRSSDLEALAVIEEHRPAIIVTDIVLPDSTGLDLLESVRSDDYAPKVIIVSGFNDFEYAKRGLKLDRKSTRLNSSHVKISYAVFCLKKK